MPDLRERMPRRRLLTTAAEGAAGAVILAALDRKSAYAAITDPKSLFSENDNGNLYEPSTNFSVTSRKINYLVQTDDSITDRHLFEVAADTLATYGGGDWVSLSKDNKNVLVGWWETNDGEESFIDLYDDELDYLQSFEFKKEGNEIKTYQVVGQHSEGVPIELNQKQRKALARQVARVFYSPDSTV